MLSLNLSMILLLWSALSLKAADPALTCLPKDVNRDALVSTGESGQESVKLEEALRRIGAWCQDGKLIDKNGRKIYFFHLIGCWGNPPSDYPERLEAQARELETLRTRFTVLEIPCTAANARAIQ